MKLLNQYRTITASSNWMAKDSHTPLGISSLKLFGSRKAVENYRCEIEVNGVFSATWELGALHALKEDSLGCHRLL